MADKFWNRKSSKYEVIYSAPSVNKTQVGNAVVPVPYPVTQKMNTASKVAKNVNLNGKPAYHKGSHSTRVKGDGKGRLGGVASGTVEAKSEPLLHSFSVKTNKKFIVREGDLQKMQGGNTIGKIVCKESGSTSKIKDNGEIEGDTLPPDISAKFASKLWSMLEAVGEIAAGLKSGLKSMLSQFSQPRVGPLDLSKVPEGKRQTVQDAVEQGYQLTTAAVADLEAAGAGDEEAIARYEQYFGEFSEENHKTVLNHYTDIQDTFEDGFTVNIDDTSEAYAYVYSGGDVEVHLGQAFWDAPTDGFDSQGGVFVHELAHEVSDGTITDIVYGQSGATSLAESAPEQAILNADNYEYYAEQ